MHACNLFSIPRMSTRVQKHSYTRNPKSAMSGDRKKAFLHCGDVLNREATSHESQKLLLTQLQGARIRHRMRQPACKGLCSEILEMHHMLLALAEAHTHKPADAGLQRQLKQHLRVRRWAAFPLLPPLHPDAICVFSLPCRNQQLIDILCQSPAQQSQRTCNIHTSCKKA